MTPVRAGVVPGSRYLAYMVTVAIQIAVVTAAIVAVAGGDRMITGLMLGFGLAIPFAALLRRMDAVVLTDDAIMCHTVLHTHRIEWDSVVGGRFAYDQTGYWTLAIDLTAGAELVLLTIAPVNRPISSAYDLFKHDQVQAIRAALRHHRIPVTVVPEILATLAFHWRIPAPPHLPTPADED